MEWYELFQGASGRIYASMGVLLILTLTFIVSLRLYFDRQKKGYLFILISLLIIMFQHILLVVFELVNPLAIRQIESISHITKAGSFILINMGLYRLYNRSYRLDNWIFYVSLAITVVISYFFMLEVIPALWLELYVFLLIFSGLFLISPHIGQALKFQLGLMVYFMIHLAYIINSRAYDHESKWLEAVELFLPIIFYSIIFLFIFERIIDLLQDVYQSAIRDGLTGLYNRRYIDNAVHQHLSKHPHGFTLFLDIDNFKELNDTQGHQKGDEVLQHVAQIMLEESENYGIVGRYGGEEIVVVVMDPEVNPRVFSEQIRRRIEAETSVTVSVGYCLFDKGMSPSQWVKNADHAMYYSKQTGKNKITGYQDLKE